MKYFVIFFIFISFIFFFYLASTSPRVIPLTINNIKLFCELADTDEKRQNGLMFRKCLKKNNGMLFKYNEEKPRSFWMKNVPIPLSIAFVNSQFKIINIQNMLPLNEEIKYRSNGNAQYAIEANKDWFQNNNIKVGDLVTGIQSIQKETKK